jgi:hypothetical protein
MRSLLSPATTFTTVAIPRRATEALLGMTRVLIAHSVITNRQSLKFEFLCLRVSVVKGNSLVAQRFDGIEFGGTERWDHSAYHAHKEQHTG